MNPLILTSLLAALACVSNLPAYAQQKATDDHAAHGKAAPAAPAADTEPTRVVVSWGAATDP